MENKENLNYTVYVLLFPNGKRYVGMTKQKLNERWSKGNGYKNNKEMYSDILKYGWDNIDKSEIYTSLSMRQAQEKEMSLIEEYNTIINGYNSTKGGECGGTLEKVICYNGKEYNSKELADLSIDGITGHDITTRVFSRGWDVNRAISQKKTHKTYGAMYNGKEYSFDELYTLSNADGVTRDDIKGRLWRGWDIDRAISQPKNVKKQPFGRGKRIYEYNGAFYNSYELLQFSNVEGLTVSDITCRINHHGWTIEEVLTKPKKRHNVLYEYNGEKYSADELAKLSPYEMNSTNIRDRIDRRGWSIEKAINTPINGR